MYLTCHFLFYTLSAGLGWSLPRSPGRCCEVGMGPQQRWTACLLGLWWHNFETSLFQMRTSGGCWLGREGGAVVPKLRATSCNGKPGICKHESAKAKAGKRGLMSKPVSIYFSLHSFLGSSLTSRGREKVTPVFKALSQTVWICCARMK